MRTEIALTFLFVLGLIGKLLHLDGANILLLSSLLTISLLYFPAAFYFFCDKVIKRQNLLFSLIAGSFLSLIPVGILFKIMHWPGDKPMLFIGMVSAPVLLAITYFLQSKKPEYLLTYYQNMLWRTGILTLATFLFYFIWTSHHPDKKIKPSGVAWIRFICLDIEEYRCL